MKKKDLTRGRKIKIRITKRQRTITDSAAGLLIPSSLR